MEACARNKEQSIPIEKSQIRTATTTGISRTAMQEIKGEANTLDVAVVTAFSTPDKRRQKASKYRLDQFDEAVFRRSVYNSYITEKHVQTIHIFRRKVKAT
jgi:uncharacterized phage-like protein YoqJ